MSDDERGVTEAGFIGCTGHGEEFRLYLEVLGRHGWVWNKGRTGSDFFFA